MKNLIKGISEAIEDFRNTAAKFGHTIQGQTSIEHQVALGQKLWALSRKATIALEPLKASIRNEALRRQKETPETIHFEASDGSRCRVSIPTPTLEVRKDTDIQALKVLLGDSFDSLFETKTVYKPREDFKEQIKEFNPAVQQAILGFVDVVPSTPKVFFEGSD